MKQPPCFQCEQRHELCHSECGRYAEYRIQRDTVNKARLDEHRLEEYFVGSVQKTAKAVNRR